jgi:phosphate transport system protein
MSKTGLASIKEELFVNLRNNFQKSLKNIQDEILLMGSLVNEAIAKSIDALKNRDINQANSVIDNDALINKKRFDIEETCVQLINMQQPMASDLRIIIAALNIIVDMERIGDYAKSIARIAIELGDEPPLKPLIDIPRMADKATEMLRRSLKAYINLDAELARGIAREDGEIDNLYDQIYHELLLLMVSDSKAITRGTRLLWIAYNLERTGGRISNICERVVYLVTGKMEEIAASKY